MIRLRKLAIPAVLEKNCAAWTEEYLTYVRNGDAAPPTVAFRYRHPEIKQAILAETFEKCAYCESKPRHVSPGQTDHILPRSKRPELVFSWDNLTFACEECNREKRDYYDESAPLINPYADEPMDHIRFMGPMISNVPGDMMGRRSIRILKLTRAPLFERRRERLEKLEPLLDVWAPLPEGSDKELIKQEIMNEALEDREYSAAVRSFLDASGV